MFSVKTIILLILSILPGIAAYFTLKKLSAGKDGDASAAVSKAEGFLYVILGAIGWFFATLWKPGMGSMICVAISCGFCIWMLLITAHMDRKSGFFSIFPMLITGLVEVLGVILFCILAKVPYPAFDTVFVIGLLFLLRMGSLAIGDVILYFLCFLSFVPLAGDYALIGFGIVVLVSSVVALFGRIVKAVIKHNKKAFFERFPFTSFIAFGYLVAVILLGITNCHVSV